MGQCKWCERRGFFLFVDTNGLCKNCSPIVIFDIEQRTRIIQDCIRLMKYSKELDTRLSRCDLLKQHAEALLKYENKDIVTIKPPPSEFIKSYNDLRREIIEDDRKERICPYCKGELEKRLKRNRKCPFCKNYIMVREDKLFREAQAGEYDKTQK